jgi:hypothetical protein
MGNLLTVQQLQAELQIVVERVYLLPAADACEKICIPMAEYTRANVVTVEEAQALNDELHPNCRCDWGHEVMDAEKPLTEAEGSRMELLEELEVFV